MSRIYDKQKRIKILSVLLVAGLTFLFGYGLPSLFGEPLWHWFACYFIGVNAATWIFFFYDKRIAGQPDRVRVPENVLFLLSVAGGLPSTLIAMHVLRHKRAKSSFKWKLFAWFTIIYALAGLAYWFFVR